MGAVEGPQTVENGAVRAGTARTVRHFTWSASQAALYFGVQICLTV